MKKVVAESKKEELTPEEVESNKKQLPDPSGYRILVAMPVADEKTEGGILKANQTIKDEEVSNICGMVIRS